jgi:hypothetical protein
MTRFSYCMKRGELAFSGLLGVDVRSSIEEVLDYI